MLTFVSRVLNRNCIIKLRDSRPRLDPRFLNRAADTAFAFNMSDTKVHIFNDEETKTLRQHLLQWYDENKRDLPWRRKASIDDPNQRAYSVWVSEIMLQQTQVRTVIDYYNRWMKKWPTVQELAKATSEEVNSMWSGLGYYSRGRRLLEGAKKVVEEFDGEMPKSAAELLKNLPGVGRYTAGAIASIAYNEPTGLVDGNVIRVFSRMRIIGSDTSVQHTTDAIWSIANSTVDSYKPGDFNQGLMELGATICTPKTPSCSACPVSHLCKAYMQVEANREANASKLGHKEKKNTSAPLIPDIECADGCKLCLPSDDPWDSSIGVQNYPRKAKKKAPRKENTAVCVLQRTTNETTTEYLMVQRPKTGLLANLWEFPSVGVDVTSSDKECLNTMENFLLEQFKIPEKNLLERKEIGDVVHIFSHIHQTYRVTSVTVSINFKVDLTKCSTCAKWVTKEELSESAISTAMKKVFKNFEEVIRGSGKSTKGEKRKLNESTMKDGKKQLSLASFFKPKSKA